MTTRSFARPSLLLLCGIIALCPTAAAQWRSGPSLANARHAPGVVRHGGDIYAVGGFGAPNSLEVLQSGATSWVGLAPLPVGQQGLAAAVVGDRIYTFGSYGPTDTCQIYDIATNTWRAGPAVPVPLYWSTAEAVGTSIYLIGGWSPPNGALSSLFILDTTTESWSQGASMPGPIQIPASATHGQFLYVFGNFAHYGNLAYVKYDLVNGTWSTFTGPPSGHGGGSEAVSAGDVVYLIGGNSGYIYEAYQTVEVYVPSSDQWLPGPNLINGRYQFGAVYLPNVDKIYAVAGRDSTASSMASVEILPASFVDLVATSETPNHGVVTGSFILTQAADDLRQQIQEVLVNRRSSLEHEWQIAGVPATGTRTLHVQAHGTVSPDHDTFQFEVRSGQKWLPALTVTKTADDNLWQAFILPAGVSGTVRIRVIDSDNSVNGTAVDSIFVDHLFIRAQ